MGTRTVYCFQFYDPGSGKLVHSPRAATMERIERMDGVPMKETAIEVDMAMVDANGFLLGAHNCAHSAHQQPQPD
jgi:hypothetical protein